MFYIYNNKTKESKIYREKSMRRVIIIVLDSLGVGALPDAELYGDKGCNTLKNIAEGVKGLHLPNLESMGLGKLGCINGISNEVQPIACYGKMAEASQAKDTIIGHWEIAGIITEKAFPVYPKGFPQEIIGEFTKAIKRDVIGNKTASGTEILNELGHEHMKTGFPIVYTSADSVFQIAAWEEIISVNDLYNICKIARDILQGEHNVCRVIARPFIFKDNTFIRTEYRKDFAVSPPYPNLLDLAFENGKEVIGIGKIGDIFNHRGLTEETHTCNNDDGIKQTIEQIKRNFTGLIFTNLVDFDMQFGHRNDAIGYANALQQFDSYLPEIINSLKKEDILILTADHGCDPTTKGTDHTREYVPLLVYSHAASKSGNLGTRTSFADIGSTIAEYLELPELKSGKSFLDEICIDTA